MTSVHRNSKLQRELNNYKLPKASFSASCSVKNPNIYTNADVSVISPNKISLLIYWLDSAEEF